MKYHLTPDGVNEFGVAMCECKPYGPIHAWEPGEWCGDRVVPTGTKDLSVKPEHYTLVRHPSTNKKAR